ncbi:MAG: HNH endonuclease [Novosphingobium sp.]|nr:HNH endonuclease [Novosphingobium sp.]
MAKRIYNTAKWKRLRKLKLQDQPYCEHCKAIGRYVEAIAVDHRTAVSQGGNPFPSLDGLASLCLRCHSAKTARGPEAGAARTCKPRRGCNADGSPLDPAHPWNRRGSGYPS